MKRVAAVAGAVVMLAVAFVIRGGGTDDAGGDSADDLTVLCPVEFAHVCGAAVDDVTTAVAADTADALIAAGVDGGPLADAAWIVPAAWADAVVATRAFDQAPAVFSVSDPVASTRVALAAFAGELPDGCDWVCAADAAAGGTDVGAPPLGSATGLPIAAAQLVQILGTAEFGPTDVRRLPDFERGPDPFRDMRTQGPGRYAAVGTTEADTNGGTETRFGDVIVSIHPPNVRIDLVVVTVGGRSLPARTRDAIADAFLAAGWDPPGSGPSGLPDGDILNQIRNS